MNHVSVSPADGTGPTQGQRKTLTRVGYTDPKLWHSLSIDVKKLKPFSSFRQYIKNSVINDYNTIIDS